MWKEKLIKVEKSKTRYIYIYIKKLETRKIRKKIIK